MTLKIEIGRRDNGKSEDRGKMMHSTSDFFCRHTELRDDPQLRLEAKSEGLTSFRVLLMVSRYCTEKPVVSVETCRRNVIPREV